MSELSGVFDQLADALKAAGASPSTTLRHQRAARTARRHTETQTFASRPVPFDEPVIEIELADEAEPEIIPPKPRGRKQRKEVDRSRDHAVYAAPHRPMRAHAHSRPDDIITERILRRAIATASKARRGVPVTLIAFLLTTLAGAGVLFLAR